MDFATIAVIIILLLQTITSGTPRVQAPLIDLELPNQTSDIPSHPGAHMTWTTDFKRVESVSRGQATGKEGNEWKPAIGV